MTTVTLHYTEELVRRAVRAFWWRVIGPLYVLSIVCTPAALGMAVWRGDRSWWIGAVGAVLGITSLSAIALYVIHYRGSIGRFRRMRVPQATLQLGDERFELRSVAGSAEMPWSAVTEIWQFSEFWLLFFSKAQFVTLPTADLSDAVRAVILDRAKVHGFKVK